MKEISKRDKAKIKRLRVGLALKLHNLWSTGHEIEDCSRIREAVSLLIKAYERV